MSPDSSDARIDPDAVRALGILLDVFADRLAERIGARLGTPTPRYADANNNPLGSSRAFLDAHRRGAFPTFRQGRKVVARWADVERYIESRPCSGRPVRADEADEDLALLESAGVKLDPVNDAAAPDSGKRYPRRRR